MFDFFEQMQADWRTIVVLVVLAAIATITSYLWLQDRRGYREMKSLFGKALDGSILVTEVTVSKRNYRSLDAVLREVVDPALAKHLRSFAAETSSSKSTVSYQVPVDRDFCDALEKARQELRSQISCI